MGLREETFLNKKALDTRGPSFLRGRLGRDSGPPRREDTTSVDTGGHLDLLSDALCLLHEERQESQCSFLQQPWGRLAGIVVLTFFTDEEMGPNWIVHLASVS